MARLLLRKEITCPSEIQVARTDGKACAGPAEFLENGQPLL
jgi:hypothetical protein